jgi:hypothetical protein
MKTSWPIPPGDRESLADVGYDQVSRLVRRGVRLTFQQARDGLCVGYASGQRLVRVVINADDE